MTTAVKIDFFISYTSDDKDWAEWIYYELQAVGYSLLMQAADFHTGNNFVLSMDDALQRAARVILVLSDSFMDAVYTQPEWAAKFADDPRGLRRSLLPVMVHKCKPRGLLRPI